MMLSWQQSAGVTAGFAVVGAGLGYAGTLPRTGPAAARIRAVSVFALEVSLVAALYTVWQYVGTITLMSAVDAVHRAEWIARFEHTVGLPSERTIQDLILGYVPIVKTANLYYDTMHFTIMFVFLVWLFFRHRDRYPAVRTTLAMTTLSCLMIQFVPVAPPRLLIGYVDTALVYHQSVYAADPSGSLAAMPSVHVAWAALIGWYVWRIGTGRWRIVGPLHAILTVFVVVATGNHWWLDGIVAMTILVACAWARAGIVHAWHAVRPRHVPAPPAVPVAEVPGRVAAP
jgi:hypothetical protein